MDTMKIYLAQVGTRVAIYNETELVSYREMDLETIGSILETIGIEVYVLVSSSKGERVTICSQFPDIDGIIRIPQSLNEFRELYQEMKEEHKRQRLKDLWSEMDKLMKDD